MHKLIRLPAAGLSLSKLTQLFLNSPKISHDYAKSPLMMDCDSASLKDAEIEDVADDKDAVVENSADAETKLDVVKIEDFDPKTDQLVEPAKFAPKDLLGLLRNIEAEIHQVTRLLFSIFNLETFSMPTMRIILSFEYCQRNCLFSSSLGHKSSCLKANWWWLTW